MAIVQKLIKRHRAQQSLVVLSKLSDRQLDDIGLCRADLRIPR